MMNSFSGRILITLILVSLFLGVSLYLRSDIEKNYSFNNLPVLQKMPEFSLTLLDGKNFSNKDILNSSVVHLWATWCGPCEAEFPEFLNYARSFEGKDILFSLVAVKDESIKVQKWIKKYGPLPSNTVVIMDNNGSLMKNLGSLKVPETLVFNNNSLFVKKFIGPQDWNNKYFKDNLLFLLGN